MDDQVWGSLGNMGGEMYLTRGISVLTVLMELGLGVGMVQVHLMNSPGKANGLSVSEAKPKGVQIFTM